MFRHFSHRLIGPSPEEGVVRRFAGEIPKFWLFNISSDLFLVRSTFLLCIYYIYIYTRVYVYIYTRVYVYIYIYEYMCIYIYTYIYTYIYIYK